MFKLEFIVFGTRAVVTRINSYYSDVEFYLDDGPLCSTTAQMSLKEFREVYGSCSVVGCDHLTLGDYLPLT